MSKLWLFFPIVLATAFAAPQASSTPLYTAVLGNGCFGPAGVGTVNSSTPLTASSQCGVPTVITEKGIAGAGPGHVGASLNVDSGICCHSDAEAKFSFTVTFTSTTPTTQVSVPVSLNLLSKGVIQGSGSYGTAWELLGQLDTLSFSVGGAINSAAPSTTNINGATFTSGGQTLGSGSINVSGGLTTDSLDVPINVPIFVSLDLSVGGFANPGTFDDLFGGSIDFPTGSDVFNLPIGFTANDPDGIVVNNRFISNTATVPEPSSLLLLASGLLTLGGLRLRRGHRSPASLLSP